MADGCRAPRELGLGSSERGRTVGTEDLTVLLRAGTGPLARPLLGRCLRAWPFWVETGFLEVPVAGSRGLALVVGGLGELGFFWVGFLVAPGATAGTGWTVGSGFLVTGADFVKGGGDALWERRALLSGAIEGAEVEGLARWLLGC